MGWDPLAGFKAISAPTPTDAADSIRVVQEIYGDRVVGVDFEAIKAQLESATAAVQPGPDDPFEAPSFVVPSRFLLDIALESPLWEEYPLDLVPFVAGLPSVGYGASTRALRSTGEAVILLQHNVLGYFMHVAAATAAALPWEWFPASPYTQDFGLIRGGSWLNRTLAGDHLTRALAAFVTTGSSIGVEEMETRVAVRQWKVELFQSSALFLLSHELAHIALGHLGSDHDIEAQDTRSRELVADRMGFAAASQLTPRLNIDGQVFALGCLLALKALESVQQGVQFLAGDAIRTPAADEYPPWTDRLGQLLGLTYQWDRAGSGDDHAEKYNRLLREALEVVQGMIDAAWVSLVKARQAGVEPSPVWSIALPPKALEAE